MGSLIKNGKFQWNPKLKELLGDHNVLVWHGYGKYIA